MGKIRSQYGIIRRDNYDASSNIADATDVISNASIILFKYFEKLNFIQIIFILPNLRLNEI